MTPAERKSLRAPRPLSKAMVQRIADRAEHKPVQSQSAKKPAKTRKRRAQ